MSRKNKHGEHANHERWLVSYADFITLLFAFFVVLYSAAQVDQRKVGALAMAIQVAFQELGAFPASNSRMPLAETKPLPSSDVQMVDSPDQTTELGRVVPSSEKPLSEASPRWDWSELQQELQKSLALEIQRREVSIQTEGNRLVLSLREIGFFDSGVAKLRPESEPPLARIAELFVRRPYHLRIEGHTDNVPIHTVLYGSNWELSTARATEITKLLLTRYSLAPERLSAAGYAEFHPVASNDTPAGRAMNRRVDIVILPPPPALSPRTESQSASVRPSAQEPGRKQADSSGVQPDGR